MHRVYRRVARSYAVSSCIWLLAPGQGVSLQAISLAGMQWVVRRMTDPLKGAVAFWPPSVHLVELQGSNDVAHSLNFSPPGKDQKLLVSYGWVVNGRWALQQPAWFPLQQMRSTQVQPLLTHRHEPCLCERSLGPLRASLLASSIGWCHIPLCWVGSQSCGEGFS